MMAVSFSGNIQERQLASVVIVSSLQNHSPEALPYLKNVVDSLPPGHSLRRKIRMIMAIKENRPLDAIKVIEEKPVLEEDDFEFAVLLNCALETLGTVETEVIEEKIAAEPVIFKEKNMLQTNEPVHSHSSLMRKKFSQGAVEKLQMYYVSLGAHPTWNQYKAIASELGVDEYRIKIWFKNKRAKDNRVSKILSADKD